MSIINNNLKHKLQQYVKCNKYDNRIAVQAHPLLKQVTHFINVKLFCQKHFSGV